MSSVKNYRYQPQYQGGQQQLQSTNGSQDASAQQFKVLPIDPISTKDQEHKFIENNRYLKNEHIFNYHNVPGANHKGSSDVERIQLAFESNLDDEVNYYLNHLVRTSMQNPQWLNLKGEYSFLIEPLSNLLNCSVFSVTAENSDINKSLDAALILRNLVQDIDNSQVISMYFKIKDNLLRILSNPIILNNDFTNDSFDQSKELLRYSMDIVEAISSYLAPAPIDDTLFLSLLELFKIVEDRSVIITILRSLSRLMYNSQKKGDAPDNFDDEILDKVVSYLVLSINKDNDNDELIITALDFLYQYLLPNRVDILLSSYTRSSILRRFLPKLLIFKLNYKTEFSQNIPILKLIKRVKDKTPTQPPPLPELLIQQLNLMPEPNRATAWMRCSYRASDDGDVTQISLWRSYESQFQKYAAANPYGRLLPAVDFIKNVQHAFPNSNAMVINLPDGTRKFIIKGIEPRFKPVDIDQGKLEALTDRPIGSSSDLIDSEMKESIQAPYQLFQYNFNDYLTLNDINTSTSLLINQLTSYEQGVDLFTGLREEFVQNLLKVPNLLPYIYDTLTELEY